MAPDLVHPSLGRFEHDPGDELFIGRDGSCNLVVLTPEGCDPARGFERLARAVKEIAVLIDLGLAAFREARERLGMPEGPSPADWRLDALVSDPAGRLWLVMHDEETDPYCEWWAAIDSQGAVEEVRRGACGASYEAKSARLV